MLPDQRVELLERFMNRGFQAVMAGLQTGIGFGWPACGQFDPRQGVFDPGKRAFDGSPIHGSGLAQNGPDAKPWRRQL